MATKPLLNLDAIEPLTDAEEKRIYAPDEMWSDTFAAKICVQDFHNAEAYRSQNCDWRWRNANELYQAWVQQKYWEGTKIPRASIGVYVAFEQIESMMPKIMTAIFADNPWFEADPLFGMATTAEQARQWRSVMIDQLDQTRVHEIFRRCIKSALQYGDGIMKLSWILRETERLEWLPKMERIQQQMLNPLEGMRPESQGYRRVIDKQIVTKMENRPLLEYVSLNDFYIDPNCSSPQVEDAAFTVERKLVTVEDLEALRDHKEFKIPSKAQLLDWARYKSSSQGDQTKATSELFRLGSWSPWIDQSVDPGLGRIEILERWTKDRCVWVANREAAILNCPNSYGFMPYYHAFYADVLDRFYSQGVCDVTEGEQRLQAALLNGRLDELALSLHRPLIKKMGIKTPQYQLRVRPGQMWEAEDPKNDYIFMDIPNITANAYVETNASDLRIQKVVGQADLYSSGTPSSGGNSASRTATGIGAQVQASGSRIQYLVENFEDTFITPMLNDVAKLNKMFPPIGTSEADTIALSRVHLSMRASAKMQSRMALMQTFPLVFQTLANPMFIAELAKQGVTPDWKELMAVLIDMTGYRNRADLVRPLTPEEKQQMNQPPPEETIKMQMQKERIAGQEKITGQKLAVQQTLAREKQESTDQTEDTYALLEIVKGLMQAIAKEKEEKESQAK